MGPPSNAPPIADCTSSSFHCSVGTPACQSSSACCAISCGASKATPLPTPRAIPPAVGISNFPFLTASARTCTDSSADLPPIARFLSRGNRLSRGPKTLPPPTSSAVCPAVAMAALPNESSSGVRPASIAACCSCACLAIFCTPYCAAAVP